jgi:hypothetical protein
MRTEECVCVCGGQRIEKNGREVVCKDYSHVVKDKKQQEGRKRRKGLRLLVVQRAGLVL